MFAILPLGSDILTLRSLGVLGNLATCNLDDDPLAVAPTLALLNPLAASLFSAGLVIEVIKFLFIPAGSAAFAIEFAIEFALNCLLPLDRFD
jgi:hypothetical protein